MRFGLKLGVLWSMPSHKCKRNTRATITNRFYILLFASIIVILHNKACMHFMCWLSSIPFSQPVSDRCNATSNWCKSSEFTWSFRIQQMTESKREITTTLIIISSTVKKKQKNVYDMRNRLTLDIIHVILCWLKSSININWQCPSFKLKLSIIEYISQCFWDKISTPIKEKRLKTVIAVSPTHTHTHTRPYENLILGKINRK